MRPPRGHTTWMSTLSSGTRRTARWMPWTLKRTRLIAEMVLDRRAPEMAGPSVWASLVGEDRQDHGVLAPAARVGTPAPEPMLYEGAAAWDGAARQTPRYYALAGRSTHDP